MGGATLWLSKIATVRVVYLEMFTVQCAANTLLLTLGQYLVDLRIVSTYVRRSTSMLTGQFLHKHSAPLQKVVVSILQTVHVNCGWSLWTVDDGGRCAIRVCSQFLLARLKERWTFCIHGPIMADGQTANSVETEWKQVDDSQNCTPQSAGYTHASDLGIGRPQFRRIFASNYQHSRWLYIIKAYICYI